MKGRWPVVNDEIIFLSELEEYGKPYFEEIRKKTPPDETQEKLTRARRDVLNQLVENKLLDQAKPLRGLNSLRPR